MREEIGEGDLSGEGSLLLNQTRACQQSSPGILFPMKEIYKLFHIIEVKM
jgi:hypothetical protein